jgi:hypothetical protein
VEKKQPYRWLKSGDVKGETESRAAAAKDQAIRKVILKIKF